MKTIAAVTLALASLLIVAFVSLKVSEASVESFAQSTQSTPPSNKPIEQTASPTPEIRVTPVTIEIELEKDRGDPPLDEISALDMLDLLVGSKDLDCDGIPNGDDNCFLIYNPNQKDKNKNGIGDACEGKPDGEKDLRCDTDKDGVLDRDDNCILVCNPDQKDKNKNGIGDVCDPNLLSDWVRIDPCAVEIQKRQCSKTKKP